MQTQIQPKPQGLERNMKVDQKTFTIRNPATGEQVGEHPQMGPQEVDAAVRKARLTFHAWSQTSFSERREILLNASSHLAENAEHYADVIRSETGKTQVDAILAEIFPTCDLLHYYAKNAEKALRPVKVGGITVLPGRKAWYTFEPRGVIGIIAPWNYPFSLASGPVISAIASGNTAVLKPSSQTTASGAILLEIFRAAGLPEGVLQVVTGSGSVTGQALIEHTGIDMLFFTGSTTVGLEVNRTAAQNLIPAVMELGGKDSMIVTRNANLERAAHAAVWGSFFNSGQTCIGVEFCFVERAVYEEFLRKVVRITETIESGTLNGQLGSMTMESQLQIVEQQVADAVAKGARVEIGGERRNRGAGLFFAPTVLTGVTAEMDVWQKETFGPILPVIPFETREEAIRMANSTEYGLSGSVFSNDPEEANWYVERMETGSVNINDCLVTFTFPSLPFGGVKKSGVGYYHSELGIRNFCRIKSVTEFKDHYAKEFFHYPMAEGVKEAMEAVLVLLYSRHASLRFKALPKTASFAGDLIRDLWERRKKTGG
jgi:acyl-CoA reductase-like NAD-dependent aldehyde dehydrogenase